jgi:predicted transcriptional regulator
VTLASDTSDTRRPHDAIALCVMTSKTDKRGSMTIGEVLRSVRTEAGMSQNELEELSGIPKARISRYENGHVEPSLRSLARLARGLGVSPAYVVRLADL